MGTPTAQTATLSTAHPMATVGPAESDSRTQTDLLLGPLPDLDDTVLAGVLAARFLTGYTGHTLRAYRQDLVDFIDWCDCVGVAALAAARSTIDVYVQSLLDPTLDPRGRRDRPLSRASVARRLVTLSGFYRYAVSEGVLDRNPVDYVRRPKQTGDSTTLGLDRHEAAQVIAAASEHSPRAGALVTLLIHAGLRINEALGADVDDLGVVRGHRVLTVTRKGGARQHIVLNAAVCDALDSYLDGRTVGPLFNTRTGGRFHATEAWRLVKRVATDAGIRHADRLSPHSARHAFVTLALEAGVPLERVQSAAGHADPRTTQRYNRNRESLDHSPVHTLGAYLASPSPAT